MLDVSSRSMTNTTCLKNGKAASLAVSLYQDSLVKKVSHPRKLVPRQTFCIQAFAKKTNSQAGGKYFRQITALVSLF